VIQDDQRGEYIPRRSTVSGQWSPMMFIIIKYMASNNQGQMIWIMYVSCVSVMISTQVSVAENFKQ